jgi:hypothetical protein
MEDAVRLRVSRWILTRVVVAVAGGCAGMQQQAKPVDQAAIGASVDSVQLP